MIAKPMGLATLNQFPQRAERLIPVGAGQRPPAPAAMARAATARMPAPVVAQAVGGLHSLAPRIGPQPFRGMPAGMKFSGVKSGGY